MCFKLIVLILLICNISRAKPNKETFPVRIRFEWIHNKGYYFETFFITNWFRANDFCISHGMELGAVESEEERDFVISEIEKIVKVDPEQPKNETRTFWLGGNNLSKYNIFTWQSTGKAINPKLWGPGEPNQPADKVCVNIWWSDYYRLFKLNDAFCNYNSYFVCQVTK